MLHILAVAFWIAFSLACMSGCFWLLFSAMVEGTLYTYQHFGWQGVFS
jgi:hypothetical protein